PAVVAPIEANPRPALPRLILQMRGLVEFFVVVDAKNGTVLPGRQSKSANLRWKITRSNTRHYDESSKSMEIWHARANRVARNFGIVPDDRKCNGSIAQHAEVERIARVLPEIFAVNHKIFSKSLFETRVEFVAKPCGRI